MRPVPVGMLLVQQVGVDQVFEQLASLGHRLFDECRARVRVEVVARHQAGEPEHPLLVGGQVGVGEMEGGGHPAVAVRQFGKRG